MRLGELLIQEKLITAEALEEALESQVVHGGRLGTNLVELGFLTEQDLARVLGRQHNSAHACGEMVPDPKALELVDLNHADQMDYLPMRVDATRLSLAVLNPHDYATLDALAFKTGKRVVPVVIPEFRMNQLQRRYTKSFRPLRAIDMNVVRPTRKEQEAEKARAAGPDLMSEEEFQNVYAQALSGGPTPSAVEEEMEVIVLEEEMELAPVAPPRPVQPPTPVYQPPPPVAAPPPVAQPPVAQPPVAQPPRPSAPVQPPPAQPQPRAPMPVPPPPVAAPPTARPTMQMGVVQPSAPPVAQPMPVPPVAQPRPVAPTAAVMPPAPPPKPAAPPKPFTFVEAQAALAGVSDREDVATSVLRFALGKWRRSLLLSVQGSLVTGWRGMGQGVHEAAVRRIGIALRDQGTFRLVRDTRSHYIGPVRKDAAMELFYKLLGDGFPKTAVILPLLVRGKVVHLLYVDNGPDQFTPPDVGELLILAQSVGRSYEAMIKRRKSA